MGEPHLEPDDDRLDGRVSIQDGLNENDHLSPPKTPSPQSTSAVYKTIVKEGTGPVVPLHAICLVRYAGRILSTGAVFVDSRDPTDRSDGDLEQIVAGRDAVRKNKGLYQLVSTMRKGEICHAWVDSSMGYGDEGSFSFPSVPPRADLSYAIELVDFEPPQNETRDGFMTYEERLEAAKRRRVVGNSAFAKGTDEASEEALTIYKSSLAFLDDDFMMQLYDFHYDKAVEEKNSVMLNMAACYLRLGRPREAAEVTSMVLATDAKNIKALYRRGVSRKLLGQTAGALEDLERARDFGGHSDAGILREIALVKVELRRVDRAQGEFYKTIMARLATSENDGNGQSQEEDRVPTADGNTTRRPPTLSQMLLGFFCKIWTTILRLFAWRQVSKNNDPFWVAAAD